MLKIRLCAMVLTKDNFGLTKDGEQVDRYTFRNEKNVEVQVITLGGCVTSVKVPDKTGVTADITPGFDTISEYEGNPCYFGGIIGRVANRIADGKFCIDGQEYHLAKNNPPNHLHGGENAFHLKLWDARTEDHTLILSRESPNGEEGYPGTLKTSVAYELTNDSELVIKIEATTSHPTIVNITNHSYWNLAGHKNTSILDHVLTVHADKFTPKSEKSVPTGELATINGTIYDFTQPKVIGEDIDKCVAQDKGYDMNFCINGSMNEKRLAARVEHEASGRVLELLMDKPGMQFYTGGYIDNIKGKGGVIYGQHSSFAIESQNYPDAINKAHFPSSILRPGEQYSHTIVYKFSARS